MYYKDDELLQSLKEKFRYCDYSESNGFTFSVEVSGASGGNCWGDYATPFRNSNDEIVSEMKDEIISGVKDFLSLLNIEISEDVLQEKSYSLAENLVDSSYDSTSYSEYYGNYSESNKYFVSLNEVLEFIEDKLSSEDKNKILAIAQEAQDEVVLEKTKENKFNYLQEIEKKITNFKTDSYSEEKKLKSQLERAKKEVEIITKKLANLEKTQAKNLENLEKTKKDLIGFLGEDYIQSKKTTKKKYGY